MKNKKIIIIIVVVLLAALIIYALLTRHEGDIVLPKDKEDLALVETYNDYVSLNNLINNYLLNVSLDDEKAVKGLTGTDLLVTNSKEKGTYYITKAYVVKLTYNDYYYVSGTKMVYDYGTSKMREVKDDSYMICVDNAKKTYRITKIGNPVDYYNNNDIYDRVTITPNDYNDFLKYSEFSEAYVYNNYINYFKDLLFVNYQEAYSMLEDSYKNKVGSLENFVNIREDLYNKLNNVVLEFAITGEKFSRTYQLILFNETKITIKENGFMNVKYKIEN